MTARAWSAVVASVLIVTALFRLHAAGAGVTIAPLSVGDTPATVYRPQSGALGPAVVIAHGFAGSRRLMQSFALCLARNGYVAVTFDFPGHGRHPRPLSGSITEEQGATQVLVTETAAVAATAKTLGDGRVALLGHSMASDIVIRTALADPGIAATVAVSMFSPVVTATRPANLLVIVGAWEPMLRQEALRAIGLASQPESPRPGVTYGDPGQGSARRLAISPDVEHIGVLFSAASQRAAVSWLDQTFGVARATPVLVAERGPWILLLLSGTVLMAWPLARLLPLVASQSLGAGLRWRRLWPALLLPAVVTPLLLRLLPTHFLPVLVADYLAAHFALYGVVTLLLLLPLRRPPPISWPAFLVATVLVTGFGFVALVWPIDRFVTSLVPGAGRLMVTLALLAGTLSYCLADEWLTRGIGAAKAAYAASKLAFLLSLGLAVALDFERLFFLVILLPVILLYFLILGLFSRWVYRQTGHPLVAGVANAIAFAWAIGAIFPLLAG